MSAPPTAPPRPNGDGNPITRRTALSGALVGAAGLAGLSGCAIPTGRTAGAATVVPRAEGPVTLTYWAWLKDLQKPLDAFNASQDRIRVQATTIASGNQGGYAKILSAVAAGGGPDIAQIELKTVPEFALAGALTELGPYGARDVAAKFDPSAWTQVVLGDRVYAVPQDTGPSVMFYNRVVLEDELGLEAPTTWAEFADVTKEVAASGRSLMSISPADTGPMVMWMQQAGARWFRPQGDTWQVSLHDEGTMQVAAFWDALFDRGLVDTSINPFSTPWMTSAGRGKMLGFIGGSWGDALIEGVPGGKGKWAVAPMPRWPFGTASGQHGGSAAAIMANSTHPAEALEFLTWLHTTHAGVDSLIENCGIGWSPAAGYIGRIRQQPSAFFSGQSYNEQVVAPAARQQNTRWVNAPVTQRSEAILADKLRARVADGASLRAAMPDVEAQLVEIMRNAGLKAEVAP